MPIVTATSSVNDKPSLLPILIAGAGPCGLVAALTLQQKGIPFIIIERAQRSKVCDMLNELHGPLPQQLCHPLVHFLFCLAFMPRDKKSCGSTKLAENIWISLQFCN